MDGHPHHDHYAHAARHDGADDTPSTTPGLNRLALSATLHCLAGCGIGEVLGMVIGTALGWGNLPTVATAVALAFTFAFGYALTLVPTLRAGLGPRAAFGLALAADTASIAVMEVVGNAVMLAVPDTMDAGIADPLFWGSLALAVAAAAAFPVSRWLVARGRGHAVVHAHHGH